MGPWASSPLGLGVFFQKFFKIGVVSFFREKNFGSLNFYCLVFGDFLAFFVGWGD